MGLIPGPKKDTDLLAERGGYRCALKTIFFDSALSALPIPGYENISGDVLSSTVMDPEPHSGFLDRGTTPLV
ncbi:MAG: hypothetical protein CVV33_09400 [Methanomicrobiales archaeon HGW-Methanomicrobiales-4]|nr:MAG: hypothetical protein CVV33_09400 [Methanomicrobiales archaeon HGW-Methanomicrobiales-4]